MYPAFLLRGISSTYQFREQSLSGRQQSLNSGDRAQSSWLSQRLEMNPRKEGTTKCEPQVLHTRFPGILIVGVYLNSFSVGWSSKKSSGREQKGVKLLTEISEAALYLQSLPSQRGFLLKNRKAKLKQTSPYTAHGQGGTAGSLSAAKKNLTHLEGKPEPL